MQTYVGVGGKKKQPTEYMYFGILEFEYYDIFDQVSLGEKDHTL